MTFDLFTARSSLLPYAFVWEKPLNILFSKTEDALWLNLYIYHRKLKVWEKCSEFQTTSSPRSTKVAKIMVVHWPFTMRSILLPYAFVWEKCSEFQMTSSLEPLGQFCTNFIWSLLRLGARKIAKMVAVHWPRWPPCPYMVKTFKNLLLQNRDALGLNLCLNHRGQGSTKVAKIMVVQVCFPVHLYGKKHLKILFSKTEDALWLNLCIYYWEHLHVCSGFVTQVSEPWPVGLL